MIKNKILCVPFNPTVGDTDNNIKKIKDIIYDENNKDIEIFVFPECATSGYPLEDLVNRKNWIVKHQSIVKEFINEYVYLETKHKTNRTLIIGSPAFDSEGNVRNQAIIINDNSIYYQNKMDLPNYGVFDEKRNFIAGDGNDVYIHTLKNGSKFAVAICEDLWNGLWIEKIKNKYCDYIFSINGSPWTIQKDYLRLEMLKKASNTIQFKPTFLYVNLFGGQDELVFDGSVIVFKNNNERNIKKEITKWNDNPKNIDALFNLQDVNFEYYENIYNACVIGLRDYLNKLNIKKVVLGISGGVDSALVATIAADAIGSENVTGIKLPSEFSSQHSIDDANDLANNLKINNLTLKIESLISNIRNLFTENIETLTGIADENIQSRSRGLLLMAYSNQTNSLLLTTGNKSECAVGYYTLYGDSSGGYNPIKDIYKTDVYALCEWRNSISLETIMKNNFLSNAENPIPKNTLTKAPSAELKENQQDSDSLPDYPILDYILKMLIEHDLEPEFISIENMNINLEEVHRIWKLVKNSEFKRRQTAPGVKITERNFGRDRRYPIVNKS